MQVFDALGSRIEEAWQRLDYDEARFPAVAAAALREAPPSAAVAHGDVIRWVLDQEGLPVQHDLDATFGDPPVTVYQGRRFFIQVILWLTGSTSIHRHGFSGAFHVLDGTSLHARYRFEERRRVSSRMRLGALHLEEAEILARGDTVAIENELAHALFHLETPSATVVVRTHHEDEAGPQYEYRPPGLALDPFHRDPTLLRKVQTLRFARRAEDPAWPALAAAVLARSDLQTCFAVLEHAQLGPGAPARMEPLYEAARRRHGEVVDALAAVLHEELRERKVQRLRAGQKDPALRFFLALLQNLPDRASILAQVKGRYPGADARAQVEAWAVALSGVDVIGVDLHDALSRRLFGALLDGASPAETLERLERVFGAAEVRAQADAIARQRDRIRRTALEPLFR